MSNVRRLPIAPKPEAYTTGMQHSMSWSWLLLECSYPFGRDATREVGEPAHYGSAIHELLADTYQAPKGHRLDVAMAAKTWGVAPDGMADHVARTRAYFDEWLTDNEYRTDFSGPDRTRLVEQAVALKPLESGRYLPPHDETHRYYGLTLGEQPGTLDYAFLARKARAKRPLLILDLKTGEAEDFSKPLDKPQLLSLGAGVMRWTKTKEAILGVLHSTKRGMPKIYSEPVTLAELAPYERRLQTAISRIGDGSMRPGPWCTRCPAQTGCPARDADLLGRAGEVLNGLTAAGGVLTERGLVANDLGIIKASPAAMSAERKLGLLYSVVRKSEALAARARDEIKQAILASKGTLLPETPEDEYLVVRTFEKEILSKKAILDAYGKIAGERLIEKLRADGAITKTTVQQLWPEKDRGR